VFQPKAQLVFVLGQRRVYCGIAVVTEYLRPSPPVGNPLCDGGHEQAPFMRNQRSLSTGVPDMYIFTEFMSQEVRRRGNPASHDA
jgi:hypothetical protein